MVAYTQVILKSDDSHWLYNEKEQSLAKTVYLGKDCSFDDWIEITDKEYKNILKKIKKENN